MLATTVAQREWGLPPNADSWEADGHGGAGADSRNQNK
jgi:hypothetical protein